MPRTTERHYLAWFDSKRSAGQYGTAYRNRRDQVGFITATHWAIPVTESVVLPPYRGKRHVSLTIIFRFHVDSVASLPELPIGNVALSPFTVARSARPAHI